MALILIPLSVFGQGVDDGDIQITARIEGCGNNIVEPHLGEQCEGPHLSPYDLNGQTCQTIGFNRGGELSCRVNSCIFDTDLCRNGNSSGSRRTSELEIQKTTDLVISATGEPGAWFVVLNNGVYFFAQQIDSEGNVTFTIPNQDAGNYSFTFLTVSLQSGISDLVEYAITIQENFVNIIENIAIPYNKDQILILEDIENKEFTNKVISQYDGEYLDSISRFFSDVLLEEEGKLPIGLKQLLANYAQANDYILCETWHFENKQKMISLEFVHKYKADGVTLRNNPCKTQTRGWVSFIVFPAIAIVLYRLIFFWAPIRRLLAFLRITRR